MPPGVRVLPRGRGAPIRPVGRQIGRRGVGSDFGNLQRIEQRLGRKPGIVRGLNLSSNPVAVDSVSIETEHIDSSEKGSG